MGILISSYKAPYEPTSTMKCHKGLITAHLFISEESFNKNNSPSLGWNFDPQERFRRVSHVFSIFNSIYIYILFSWIHNFFWMGLINQLQVKVPVARTVSFFFVGKQIFQCLLDIFDLPPGPQDAIANRDLQWPKHLQKSWCWLLSGCGG